MLICTPIQAKTQKEVQKRLKILVGKVDLAEIWLDHIEDLDIKTLLKSKPLPVICVCKKPIEKGRFKGTYAQMIDVLVEAVKNGADYVDIPLSGVRIQESGFRSQDSGVRIQESGFRSQDSGVRIQESGHSRLMKLRRRAKVIISYHNFTKTPKLSELLKKAREMKKRGADIIKIAVMARSLSDTLTMIALAHQLQNEGIPHILIAMGKKGTLSRILTPTLGGTIMFAPISRNQSNAPGQLTVKELREAWSLIKY